MNQVLSRYEVVDPDQVASLGRNPCGQSRHLGGDFGCIRTAGHDDHLVATVELGGRRQKQWKAFLSCDAPVEQAKGPSRGDAKACQRLGRRVRPVAVAIDSVLAALETVRCDSGIATPDTCPKPPRPR